MVGGIVGEDSDNWTVNNRNGVCTACRITGDPAGRSEAQGIRKCDDQRECRPLRPVFTPVEDPHSKPDTECGKGNAQDWKQEDHAPDLSNE
jgi:hypothetical protein